MSELWKAIYGYESYEVSTEGKVRGKNGILKPQPRRHGYLAVWLYKKGSPRGKQFSVHRLVAEAFCVKKDGQTEVNHLNEDKQDNRAINLEWCTKQENCSYGNRGTKISNKNTNGKRSKPIRQLTLSGMLIKEYPSMHEAKRQTGFAEGNIYKAIHGVYSQAYGYKWEYLDEGRD